jgi:hypothetical protein
MFDEITYKITSPPLVGGDGGEGDLTLLSTPTPTLPHQGGGDANSIDHAKLIIINSL